MRMFFSCIIVKERNYKFYAKNEAPKSTAYSTPKTLWSSQPQENKNFVKSTNQSVYIQTNNLLPLEKMFREINDWYVHIVEMRT